MPPNRKSSFSSSHLPDLQHAQRQTILTRLQSFFPRSPKTVDSATIYPEDAVRHENTSPLPSSRDIGLKYFKIKLLTWNMHDSLPKGELGELFGTVPPYSQPTTGHGIFPVLPNNSDHPYHLVVVNAPHPLV
ncbi:hypothetical protein CPB84DRAFT_627288 [Gymnopilus junonius]|uniref:Uncharacterized protein n=1 Tax=Gymnopilus junonius TaxID=109634 RepID=A0A9P5NQ86_GYMJU|nr:hypothetical protein CPB84DRAFT_627288 [Gymnopilus junonius]